MVTQCPIQNGLHRMNFEVLSFQMIYNLWWLLKDLIRKKDNVKKSAKRPKGGTVTVKGLQLN